MPLSADHRTLIKDLPHQINETVTVSGFIETRRDHGKLIFLDLRDRSGLLQLVINPQVALEAHQTASKIRSQFVIEAVGTIKERGERQINPNLPTGKIELEVTSLHILSHAKELPFELDNTKPVNEELRLKYRYLDLRSERMSSNLRLRHKVTTLVRDYLNQQDFIEIETPLLTKTSPEGARDFLVPSRLQPGKFYALPQAPQQYKQLLMIAGFERYYQIARALRDEDLRGDRQPEHTQIDMELAYASQKDILAIVEGLIIHIAESCGKKVWKKPFPVFTHDEAMKQFGADKFDLREDKDPATLAFAWVVDFPLLEWDAESKGYTFAHNPFSAPNEADIDKLMKNEDLGEIKAQQYDLVCNGYELASGGVRISDPVIQRKVFEIMGLSPEETEKRFGHLIHAYEYGAPPHAGIAPGLDRLVMLLANEDNIREVIAFPVTSGGTTAVMEAPSEVLPSQLQELHIKVDEPKK